MPKVVRVFQVEGASLQTAIDGFLAVCKAKNLSPNTASYYGYRLMAFTRFLEARGADPGPEQVNPSLIREFLTSERERASATTAHHSLLALRAFFNHLVRDGLLDTNPALAVDKPKRRVTIIPTLAPDQAKAILDTCERDFYGVRDRAILLLMLDTGLRVQELVTLEMVDVSLERQTVLVVGKGDKERQLPYGSGVRAALAAYLARRGDTGNGRFFVNHYKEPLTRHAVRYMIRSRGLDARIAGVRLSPHTLRHTFAKMWLVNGGDVFSLQRMLGHSTMEMVRNYVNLVAGEVASIHRFCSPVDRLEDKPKTGRRRLM